MEPEDERAVLPVLFNSLLNNVERSIEAPVFALVFDSRVLGVVEADVNPVLSFPGVLFENINGVPTILRHGHHPESICAALGVGSGHQCGGRVCAVGDKVGAPDFHQFNGQFGKLVIEDVHVLCFNTNEPGTGVANVGTGNNGDAAGVVDISFLVNTFNLALTIYELAWKLLTP